MRHPRQKFAAVFVGIRVVNGLVADNVQDIVVANLLLKIDLGDGVFVLLELEHCAAVFGLRGKTLQTLTIILVEILVSRVKFAVLFSSGIVILIYLPFVFVEIAYQLIVSAPEKPLVVLCNTFKISAYSEVIDIVFVGGESLVKGIDGMKKLTVVIGDCNRIFPRFLSRKTCRLSLLLSLFQQSVLLLLWHIPDKQKHNL